MNRPAPETSETVEVVQGAREVGARIARFLSRANGHVSIVSDRNGLGVALEMRGLKRLGSAPRRKLKLRYITEITKENEAFARTLAGLVELRHLDGVSGNFAVSDSGEFISAAVIQQSRPLNELIYGNAPSVVSQHNLLFETLWVKAVGAESRLRELDEGAPPVKTRLLEGETEIVRQIASMTDPWEEVVACMTTAGLGAVFDSLAEPISLLMSKGGRAGRGAVRWLTSIGERDLEMVEVCLGLGVEVRHTSRLPPLSFVCSRSQILASIEASGKKAIFQNVLSSNDPAYVGHFRSLFEAMWKNGVDSRKRIQEIVGGIEHSTVEVVENPQETLRMAWDLIENSREILLMFSTPRAFLRQINAGAFERLKHGLGKTGTTIKILIPYDEQIVPLIEKAKAEVPTVDFRVMSEGLKTKISILVADMAKTLVIETRDDDEEGLLEALGTATYTESRSLAVSYAAIFENIWKQTDMLDKLKLHEKLQSDFVNIAAHELRTPVQAIINYAELAAANTENRDEYFVRLLRNVTRLQKLTEDLLEAARIDSGTLRLTRERFDINALVEAAAEEQRASTNLKGVGLVVVPSGRLIVEGDKGRLGRVVSNLLSNAVKFTEKGTISVTIEANKEENRVLVRVSDTGTGIDPSIVPMLFSRFVARSRSGTGLGLYISKSIVDEHGGRIWVESSEPG
ncbi:MAG TPA: HAMP domain-containing sensor histidine kinase, partial [Nitrososphaerales archaeon]|nr:HAMP domain-containing sensor histidine kinase [Nitrososphaerales archaeon]